MFAVYSMKYKNLLRSWPLNGGQKFLCNRYYLMIFSNTINNVISKYKDACSIKSIYKYANWNEVILGTANILMPIFIRIDEYQMFYFILILTYKNYKKAKVFFPWYLSLPIFNLTKSYKVFVHRKSNYRSTATSAVENKSSHQIT